MIGADTPITWADLTSVFSSITGQFTVPNMVGVVAGALGIAVVFCFMWFGIKKCMAIIKSAINSGTLSTGGKARRR
jgi:hypothetical protein